MYINSRYIGESAISMAQRRRNNDRKKVRSLNLNKHIYTYISLYTYMEIKNPYQSRFEPDRRPWAGGGDIKVPGTQNGFH